LRPLWPSCVNDFFVFGRGDAALCPSVKSAFSLRLGATPATLRVAMWVGPCVRFSWLSTPGALASPFSQMGQAALKKWTIFRTEAKSAHRLPRRDGDGTRHAISEERIMNYAQFHALYEALKERVGSVRKPRTR